MQNYRKPEIKFFSASDLAEAIGPLQTAYMTVEGWRGTKLDQPTQYEYKIAGLERKTSIFQFSEKREV